MNKWKLTVAVAFFAFAGVSSGQEVAAPFRPPLTMPLDLQSRPDLGTADVIVTGQRRSREARHDAGYAATATPQGTGPVTRTYRHQVLDLGGGVGFETDMSATDRSAERRFIPSTDHDDRPHLELVIRSPEPARPLPPLPRSDTSDTAEQP